MSDELRYKDLETLAELEQLQELEGIVWETETTPTYQTLTNIQHGGIAQGAYDGEQLVGFTFGFPGFRNKKVYFCCHMIGIHPEYRRRGLGQSLMWFQRRRALEMGYTMITWTFDPLETVNAMLYLHKLHAVSAYFRPNHYGSLNDGINDGLPTDRLVVEWWIASNFVKQMPDWLANLELKHCLSTYDTGGSDEAPAPGSRELEFQGDANFVAMPVPAHFQLIKDMDMDLALAWRERTAKWFTRLHDGGYAAFDLRWSRESPLCHYLFAKRERVENAVKRGMAD